MSSPLRPDADLKEQLDWYKTQYAQLETDLADFQASSKDLEEQLEKDVEVAEKNERKWKEQVEKLKFEVDEWKMKHKQAKTEANTAHNALQKEITTMRETARTLQLRLRDTEVMNDDYERQARNTETSLEDMETKYNASIERGVLFEETIRQSEQEREALRIETQRLRDDLSDLKVENEITLEKLRLAEGTIEGLRSRKPSSLAVESLRTRSPASEASGMTPLSPTASTPPPKSDTASDTHTPPSPPLSDVTPSSKPEYKTPVPVARRKQLQPESATPRPSMYGPRVGHSRGPSVTSTMSASTATSDAKGMRPPGKLRMPSRASNVPDKLPRSESLYQIRGLIGRMQKIEERVQNARSKLPTPGTPRGSPRTGSAPGNNIPSSVTVRRSSKRPSVNRVPSMVDDGSSIAEESSDAGARPVSHVKRLSYGIPRPTSQATSRSDMPERPPSALDRPASVAAASRPSSRASMSSQSNRPPSRSGARTDQGHYPGTTASTTSMGRPRSSLGGSYAGTSRGHRPSASVTEARQKIVDGEESGLGGATPSRRTTLERSGLPTPTSLPTPSAFSKSTSGGLRAPRATGSRTSNTFGQVREEGGDSRAMKPPAARKKVASEDVGETY